MIVRFHQRQCLMYDNYFEHFISDNVSRFNLINDNLSHIR